MAENIIVELCWEENEEITLSDGRAELEFSIFGTQSALAARNALRESEDCPERYHEFLRQTINLKRIAPTIFHAVVKYGKIDKKIALKIDGKCDKVTKHFSLKNIGNINVRDIATRGPDGPNFGGLVNVQKDKVKGAEVYEPRSPSKYTLSWQEPFADLDPGFVTTLESLRATVNDVDIAFTVKGQQYFIPEGCFLSVGFQIDEGSNDNARVSLDFVRYYPDHALKVGERDGRSVPGLTDPALATACVDASALLDAQVELIDVARATLSGECATTVTLNAVAGVDATVNGFVATAINGGTITSSLGSGMSSLISQLSAKLNALNNALATGQTDDAKDIGDDIQALVTTIDSSDVEVTGKANEVVAAANLASSAASGGNAQTVAAAAAAVTVGTDAGNLADACHTAFGVALSALTTAQDAIAGILDVADPAHATIDITEGAFYVWIHTIKTQDDTLGTTIEIPDSVHIEKFYEAASFAQFGVFDVLDGFDEELDEELEEEEAEEVANEEDLP